MRVFVGTILRWLSYIVAAGVMLLALLVGVARLLLPLVPEYQNEIRRWAESAGADRVGFKPVWIGGGRYLGLDADELAALLEAELEGNGS